MNTAAPIIFRGQKHQSYKSFSTQGQHRSSSPEETLATMLPIARKCGVTRVADITGLDKIGVPVTAVMRPNSWTLSTASGKGLTLKIAEVSGIMEAIELHHAENVELPTLLMPYEEIKKRQKVIDLQHLPLKKNSLFNTQWPEYWTNGWDIVNQQEVAVPLHCVQLKKQANSKALSLACFQGDSNGLASGNNFTEAVCSAVLEVIERDALTCIECANELVGYEPPGVNLNNIPFDAVNELVAILTKAKMDLRLYNYTVDTDIPVFKALISDKECNAFGLSGGYGAHLDPQVAMLRAITEAIQGRAVVISGSRDDVFKFDLLKIRNSDMIGFRKAQDSLPTYDMSYASKATHSFHGDLSIIIQKLKLVGVESMILFDLTLFGGSYSVVKAVIPALEGYKCKNSYLPRERAINFAQRHNVGKMSKIPTFSHLPAGGTF